MNLHLDAYHWRTTATEREFEGCVREYPAAVCFNGHLTPSGGILLGPNVVEAIRESSLDEKKLLALSLLNCAVARGESELLFIIFINEALVPATRLSSRASLEYLQLQNCGINNRDAEVIAGLMRGNCSLKYLGLYNNVIEDPGVFHLAEALAGNDKLLTLNLCRNLVSDDGAEALAKALKENITLQLLDLSMNLVTDQGCNALIKAVSINTFIIYINIFSNAIKKKQEAKLISALGRNEAAALARLEREKTAYVDVFQNRLKGSWKRSKLMIVGQGKSGKTSTVRSLLGKQFEPDWLSTLGAEITQTRVQNQTFAPDTTRVWNEVENDTSLNMASELAIGIALSKLEENKEDTTQKYKSNKEYPGWFGPLSRKLMKSLKMSRNSIFAQASEITEEANVAEAEEENLEDEEQMKTEFDSSNPEDMVNIPMRNDDKIKAFGYKQHLFSRRNVENVQSSFVSFSIWDYGGQTVFYSLHHLFLTKFGVYLLVFSSKELLQFIHLSPKERAFIEKTQWNDTPEEYIKFWLNSCDMHAPGAPIVIVGTFSDEVDSQTDLEKLNKTIEKLVEGRFSQIVSNRDLLFFPIDNRSQNGINDLRMIIESAAAAQDYVNYQVSIWWMKCLDETYEYAKGQSWIKLKYVIEIAERNYITNAAEIGEMLSLFNELGTIVYLNNTEALRDVITLNAQWLLTCLGKLVHDAKIHALDSSEIKKTGLEQDVSMAYERGLVSRDLLEYLWRDKQEHVDFLLDLMKHTILLSEWKAKMDSPDLVKDKLYLIPSLLQEGQTPEKVVGFMCMFDFSERYLPIGIFERLVCLLVSLVGQEHKKKVGVENKGGVLYKNWCKVYLHSLDTSVFLEKKRDYLLMAVDRAKTCPTIFQMLSSMLKRINEEVMGSGLKWKVCFEDVWGASKMLDYEDAKKCKLKPWFLTFNEKAQAQKNKGQEQMLDSFLDTF
mmetsp:Transcript_3144/g.4237  ORF Transcript_3144/g.4237 Transcript_3144/m.4237 type:complete len:948 (+) Transcript_3144:202-3045(+)